MKTVYFGLGLAWVAVGQATNCIFTGITFCSEIGLRGDMVDLDIEPGLCSKIPKNFDKSVLVRSVFTTAWRADRVIT